MLIDGPYHSMRASAGTAAAAWASRVRPSRHVASSRWGFIVRYVDNVAASTAAASLNDLTSCLRWEPNATGSVIAIVAVLCLLWLGNDLARVLSEIGGAL